MTVFSIQILFSVCEIFSWCPVEQDSIPVGKVFSLMDRVDKYTVYIKNSIAFPYFGEKYRRNNVIPGPRPTLYHPVDRPLGQIFWLGDVVSLAKGNFTKLSLRGGVISISIQWNCDLGEEVWNLGHFNHTEIQYFIKICKSILINYEKSYLSNDL